MDLETTFSTISESLPQEITNAVNRAAAHIPAELSQVIRHAASYAPAELDIGSTAQFLLYFSAAVLILGILGRVALGKRSSLNHSLSSVMGILFVYAVTIIVYTFKPWNLEELLSPLPFVTFSGDYLIVLPLTDTQFPALCSQLLSLVILAFLVNLLDTFIPQGKNIFSWLILRLVSVSASMVLHFFVCWAFRTYLPEVLVEYAPAVLLFILLFMMLSGLINLIFSLLIIMTNPFMGAMYSFFFSNVIGKQITKAVFTSGILCVVFFMLEYFGYTVISVSASALVSYVPLALVLLILWYLIGHIL